MTDQSEAFAAAEGREYLANELGDKSPKWVREYAGLIDDPEILDYLNYCCSLYRQEGADFLETELAKQLVKNAATGTIDDAFRGGNISQMKGMVGLTNQTQDGDDLLTDAAERLKHEGSIGLIFGSPGTGKTALTIDLARIWQARTGGRIIGNTGWEGFDAVVTSDIELLQEMAAFDGPALAVIDEVAQELSGFGEGNKTAEIFSNSLTFIRKREESHGPHAKRGSVLMVSQTRKKTAKPFRDLANFAIEKPSTRDQGRARLLDSEGGQDDFNQEYVAKGLTDTAANYDDHEASTFEIVGEGDQEGDGDQPDADTLRREEAIRTVIKAVDRRDMSYAETAELVEYGNNWVGDIYRKWRDENQYTEIVPKDNPSKEV